MRMQTIIMVMMKTLTVMIIIWTRIMMGSRVDDNYVVFN